jgi:hypothetical protein
MLASDGNGAGVTVVNEKRIPSSALKILKDIMEESGVYLDTITSTNRTVADQVRVMYRNHFIPRYEKGKKVKEPVYAEQGQAVIRAGDEIAKTKTREEINSIDADIVKAMTDELIRQLPSAKANNKLMHVDRQDSFIVFDVFGIKPYDKLDAFEAVALRMVKQGKLHRYLGSKNKVEPEGVCHFEIAIFKKKDAKNIDNCEARKKLVEEGHTHFDAKNYEKALEKFSYADTLTPLLLEDCKAEDLTAIMK